MLIKLIIISQSKQFIIIYRAQMGNCAGCANPERRYRTQNSLPRQSPELQRQPTFQSPGITKSGSKQEIIYNAMQSYAQPSEIKPRPVASSSNQDPWKSRIASRTVKKYIKKSTLKEEESMRKENFMNEKQSSFAEPIRFIRTDSLDQSIIARKNMTLQEGREKYKNQYRQQFCQESAQIKQILYESSSSRQSPQPTPLARRLYTENSPFTDFDSEPQTENSRARSAYLPKKMDRIRNKQLAEIMEMIEKDAETPAYVKDLRKMQGEDIKVNNFNRFEPVGGFEWFSLGKYLGQIRREDGEEAIDKGQLKPVLETQSHMNQQRTLKKKPLTILTEQSDPQLPITLSIKAK